MRGDLELPCAGRRAWRRLQSVTGAASLCLAAPACFAGFDGDATPAGTGSASTGTDGAAADTQSTAPGGDPAGTASDATTAPNPDGDDDDDPDDDATETDGASTGEAPPEPEPLFIGGEIIEIALQVPEGSAQSLRDDPDVYVPADVIVHGVAAPQIGIKLRGNYGSFLPFDEKPKFRLDFNRYVPGQKPFGYKAVDLNNGNQDCTLVREHIGYQALAAVGLPSRRTAHAHVTVNGQDYGMYLLLEKQDDDFVGRFFEDDSGNLYNGSYTFDNGQIVNNDIEPARVSFFNQQEGIDVGHADVAALAAAADAYVDGSMPYAEFGTLFDWTAFHRMWAWQFWVGQRDGYMTHINNYRLYFNPADGHANMFPTDLDLLFDTGTDARQGRIAVRCGEDASCWAAQVEASPPVFEALEAGDFAARFEAVDAFVRPFVDADPKAHLTCTDAERDMQRQRALEFMQDRTAVVTAAWAP